MWAAIVLSAFIIFVCVLLLGVKILFKKNGKFPNTHIGQNKAMKERGIRCAQTQDYEERTKRDIFDLPEIN